MLHRFCGVLKGALSSDPKVVTMGEEQVAASARSLAELVAGTFQPTHVVAIANGGVPVARAVIEAFPEAQLLTVQVQRPGTKAKSSNPGFARLAMRLPYWATTPLRRAEHWWRYKRRDFAEAPLRPEELVSLEWPQIEGGKHLLIVDDAVDTGLSIERVVADASRYYGKEIEIRTAALTVSGVNPLARCDYHLHRNVNIRFYWSKDYRG